MVTQTIAALFGALLSFSQIATPSNTVTPQNPTFSLQGFHPHNRTAVSDPEPMYVPETGTVRAMVLIRFTPGFDGTCGVYDLSKDDPARRIGPLPVSMESDPSNTFAVHAGKESQIIAGLPDAADIARGHLNLDVQHPEIGIACVPSGSDGSVFYSELYAVDAPLYSEPSQT
ncbi:MAG: hypothetical protein KGL39_49560 [Patescibacteria group bacterium]|nr:hypothetical protein [Patescibacteria group bacterium]